MTIAFQCPTCSHYWGVGQCDAFPEGIPAEILAGDYDHQEPYEGDNGIQFESIAEQENA